MEAKSRISPEIPVRYEDRHLAVVAKPAGIVVHPARESAGDSLVGLLARIMPLAEGGGPDRPGIVHRLDKDTSGLLVVAKTDSALTALLDSMKARAIRRTYSALVWGLFGLPQGRVEAPIRRSVKDPTRMSVGSGGRSSSTNFKVVEPLESASFLEVELETGRTHQIRVHLAHIRHPVVGDPVYGPGTLKFAESIGLERPFLHAARLRFTHPLTGAEIDVNEPLPPDLEAALSSARHR